MKKIKRIGRPVAACVLAFGMMATPVANSGILNAFADASVNGKYFTDFATYEEELAYARELNQEIFAESVVLMKNKDNALPLNMDVEKNLSVVGMLSYNTITGGTGSGAGNASNPISIESGLQDAGFNLNQKVANIYKNTTCKAAVSLGFSVSDTTVEAPFNIVNNAKGSFNFYGDAVIWTIGRVGGEGQDLFSYNVPTQSDKTKHILELDDNERDVLSNLEAMKEAGVIKKIIVLMNTANVFEMGDLEDNDNVDAILWIGQPGSAGLGGLSKVLTGEVSPSGRTADIWNADHKNDPTWANNGKPGQNGTDPDTGKAYTTTPFRVDENGEYVALTGRPNRVSLEETGKIIEYEEGIYFGYKYYETAAAEGILTDERVGYVAENGTIPAAYAGDEYYNRSTGVIYPFGYGLSYTTFAQELVTDADALEAAINNKNGLDDKVTVQVKVTNTGDVAGKEVTQLYVHAPYTAGGIEKAEVSLVSFGKTGLLQPGQSEIVTMEVRIGDIASFDYNDANDNGYKGYEIEAGAYEFRLQANSHEVIDVLGVALNEKTTSLDNDTDAENNTPFSNGDDYDTLLNIKDTSTGEVNTPSNVNPYSVTGEVGGNMVIMTRADMAGTFPTPPKASDVLYGKRVIELLYCHDDKAAEASDTTRYTSYADSRSDKETDPWYIAEVPSDWTQGVGELVEGKYQIQMSEMFGLSYGDAKWTQFMNQFTYNELVTMISSNGSPAVKSVDKPALNAADGPGQLSGGTFWCCAVNIGSTFNLELAATQARCIGNESLYLGITGWWGPGVNIHRSAFGGRNFEYYSQDGVHEGLMVATIVEAYESKGGIAYMKHFAVNDMEDLRYGCGTFVDEQTIRECYLKPFEYGVKDGGAGAMMASHNRLGCIQNYGNYALTTAIAVKEWGFDGYLQTDMYVGYSRAYSVIRSGVSILMGSFSGDNKVTGTWDAEYVREDGGKGAVRDGAADENGVAPVSYTQWYWVRNAAQRLLYVQANSNVMDNNIKTDLFANKTFQGTETIAFNASVAVDEAFGADEASYTLTSGTLPAGLSFNALTGAISGTPTTAGTYSIKVKATADGWVTKEATFTLVIKPVLEVNVETQEVKVGNEFTANAINNIQGFEVVEESTIAGKVGTYYIAASYAAEGLPAGLAIDAETGAITGTPTEAGTFNVTVKLNYTQAKVTSGKNGTTTSKSNGSFVAELVINVASDDVEVVPPQEEVSYATSEEVKALLDRLTALENAESGDYATSEEVKALQAQLTALKEAVEASKPGDDVSYATAEALQALQAQVAELENKVNATQSPLNAVGCNASTGIALAVVIPALAAVCFINRKKED